ncbi:MAG: hypothetical protein B9S32_05315 [Verrucomicrobia bacterium Tous-C9LFEB]|nr:MAG: hypothetical protein B9S32_05315 [Verrucomicrobia bacterium Tous-C9LFEB]
MKIYQWHNYGAILSGVISWSWRNREIFKDSPDVQSPIVDFNIFPGRERGPLDEEKLFDVKIQKVPELLVFLKRNINEWHIVNYCFDVLEAIDRVAPTITPRLKLIGWCHSDEDFYYYHLLKHRKRWSALACVSERTFEVCNVLFPELAGRIFLIPCFNLPPPPVEPPRQVENPVRIIYFGRMWQQQKRILDFIPLIEKLKGKPFHFTFVGDGLQKAELQQRLAPYAAQVTFKDVIAPWDIPEELSHHDIFMLVSEYEGNSVALLESMMAGLAPFVTRTRSGQSHLVNHMNCVQVPIGDMNEMAHQLETYAAQPDFLMLLKQQSRQSAQKLVEDLGYRETFLKLAAPQSKSISSPAAPQLQPT